MPRLTDAEKEVVISKSADEGAWTIYATDPKWTRVFRELAEKVGGREFQH